MAYGTAPTSGGTGDAVTTDTIATIDGGGGTFGEAQIVKVAYGATGDANVVSSTQPFPTSLAQTPFVPNAGNTSTANLAPGAVFSGTISANPSQPSISVNVRSDQPVELRIRQSTDAAGVNVLPDIVPPQIIQSSVYVQNVCVAANSNYWWVQVKNIGSATTTSLVIDTGTGWLWPVTSLGNSPSAINEIGGVAVSGSLPVTVATPAQGLVTRSQAADAAQSGAYPSSVTLKGEAGGPLEGVALLDELVQGNFQIPVINTDLLKGPNGGLISADGQIYYAVGLTASTTSGALVIPTTGYPSLTVSGVSGVGTALVYFSDSPAGPWNQSFLLQLQSGSLPSSSSQVSINVPASPLAGWVPVTGSYAQIRFSAVTTAPVVAAVVLRLAQCPPPAGIYTATVPMNLSQLAGGSIFAEDSAANTTPLQVGGVVRSAILPNTIIAGDAIRQTFTTSGAILTEKHAVPELTWNYAPPASGLVNTTTAVTIKAAVAGQRGNISSIQIQHEPLGAATEFAIRDGAAGTVLFRIKMPLTTAEGPQSYTFDPPLRQAAVNTLLEIVTLTASVTGAVYFNAQGFMSN